MIEARNVLRLITAAVAACSFAHAAQAQIPEGMTPLLKPGLPGWHWSASNHHGTTGRAVLERGVLYLSQQPYGQGGLFLTDKRYRDFELYFETDMPWGLNS